MITVACNECFSEYNVVHDMIDTKYVINNCTFCGSDNIEHDEPVDISEEED